MKNRGLIHLYYGTGKGKTTSSLGLALRAWGWGKKVVVFQFLKPKDFPSGEMKALRKLDKKFKIIRFRKQQHPLFNKSLNKDELKKSITRALIQVEKIIKEEKYAVVVLDEILNAVSSGFITEKEIIHLFKRKPPTTELILTGRSTPPIFKKFADYISEIKEIKHPFQKGIKARKGIEY
ncbi:MAG: cob(I)yrinic acid a,c-diamide adenosyltransferase [Candidatus Omnitrophica bacterium]|nr:cob(I)yrinic acid a,c-diamide adenosyltransferase [Candidatus Omnitrophota bacterium]